MIASQEFGTLDIEPHKGLQEVIYVPRYAYQ